MNNSARVARAIWALTQYGSPEEGEARVIDLLTDLRHFCAHENINFLRALWNSKLTFEEEPDAS